MSDIHWLAGLMEGEGCFYVKTKPRRNAPALSLAMTDLDVVERAAALMGNLKVFPKRPADPRHKDQHYIGVTGKKAVAIMRELLPYMGQRRSGKIREILELCESGVISGDGKSPRQKVGG